MYLMLVFLFFLVVYSKGPRFQQRSTKAICTEQFPGFTTFYIDPDNICGQCDDDNDGSITSPLCTLTAGVKAVQSGGKVILREGIHRVQNFKHLDANAAQFDWNNISGTSERYTEIRNFPGEKPRYYNSLRLTDWTLHSGNIYKICITPYVNKWYYTYNVVHNVHMVIVDDDPENPIILQEVNTASSTTCTSSMLPSYRTDETDMIAGDFYYERASETVYIWLPDSSDPRIHDMEVAFFTHTRFANQRYLKINGIEFRYAAGENVQCGWSMVSFGGSDIILENNRFMWSDATCLGGGGKRIIVRNNYFGWCGNSGTGMKGPEIIFEDNVFEYNNYKHYSCGWHCGALKIIPGTSSMVFRGNVIQNNFGNGLWLDHMAYNNTIEQNYFFDNQRHSIFVEITNENAYAGLPGTIVRENLIVGSGIRAIYCSASNYTHIYNNLLFNNTQGLTIHGMPRTGHVLTNNRAERNLVLELRYRCHNAQMYLADDAWNNSYDDNVYDRDGRHCISWESTVNFYSRWQAEYGFDNHSYLIGKTDYTYSADRLYYHLKNKAPIGW